MRALLCVLLSACGLTAAAQTAPARIAAHVRAHVATHVKGYYRKDGTYVRPHETRTPSARTYRAPATPRATAPYRAPRAKSYSAPRAKSYSAPRTHAYTPPTYGTPPRDEHGRFIRSQAAKDEFRRHNPCPCTGRTTGPCPGYVIDHIKALKRGGPDSPANMQWQTVAEAKAKDKWE